MLSTRTPPCEANVGIHGLRRRVRRPTATAPVVAFFSDSIVTYRPDEYPARRPLVRRNAPNAGNAILRDAGELPLIVT